MVDACTGRVEKENKNQFFAEVGKWSLFVTPHSLAGCVPLLGRPYLSILWKRVKVVNLKMREERDRKKGGVTKWLKFIG